MSHHRPKVLSKSEADALIARFKADLADTKHVLAVDFEATCDEDRTKIPRHESEIIEFGTCRVDLTTGEKFEWGTFVKPVVHPKLSAFCTELTTITQEQVDTGVSFKVACDILEVHLACDIGIEKLIWVSWGQYDFNQLKTDLKRAGCTSPLDNVTHYNLKEIEAAVMGRRQVGLNGAVAEHKLEWHGTHHRGVDDAVNVANILLKLIKDIA
ncbi:sporulation inhibitor KapD [compost metagenome]